MTITKEPKCLHLTYIWLGGNNELRQKVKLLSNKHNDSNMIDEDMNSYLKNPRLNFNGTSHITKKLQQITQFIPIWNYDGSSTNQAERGNSEVILIPKVLYPCPFKYENNDEMVRILVLCETYLPSNTDYEFVPHPTNHRVSAKQTFNKIFNDKYSVDTLFKPCYGIEQEFFITTRDGTPLQYQENELQGKFYCSINSPLNKIVDDMLHYCQLTGLNVVGSNLEVAPGQAEIQILEYGLKACDDLVMLRYIISQTASLYDCDVNIQPKPLKGDWNGSGAHVNYSTSFMRNDMDLKDQLTNKEVDKPYDHIMYAISQLDANHQKHIDCYGEGNEQRLTGEHETSSMDKFTYGVADRGASVRIPRATHRSQFGYIEDRRPSSNFNPYQVLPLIFETTTSGL